MGETPIIDAHVHLWDQRRTPREGSPLVKLLGWHQGALHWAARRLFPKPAVEFFGKPDHVLADYLVEDYDADTVGRDVAGFVHVEAGWIGKGPMAPVAETVWLESLDPPKLKGIVGHADLRLGDAVDEVLVAHMQASPRLRGIRQVLYNHPDKGVADGIERVGLTRDAAWRHGYAAVAKRGLSFETVVYNHQIPELAELAGAFPEVQLILCHVGAPLGFGGPFGGQGQTPAAREDINKQWRDAMAELAEHPNVFVKLSAFTMPCLGWGYHQGEAPSATRVASDVGQLIAYVVDTFGAERCMFGSNFPVDKVCMPWTTLCDAVELAIADRSDAERRALLHDTAISAYRLAL